MRPFTGMALDRASNERKDPVAIERLLSDPAARAVVAGHDGILLVQRNGSTPALLRTPIADTPASAAVTEPPDHLGDGSPPADEPILLGVEDGGQAVFAIDLDALADSDRRALTERARLTSLREAGADLPHPEGGLAAYATALLNWHRRHRFCPNCGALTRVVEAGYSRHCPRCGAHHFPRTDPVVIMTVEHDGHLLLGRRAGWPSPRMSVLAGFVSPGESAEEAVVREVQEESGIVARDPGFVSSQPWPFPASLMLGFHAESDGGEPRASDRELDEVHWFDHAEVAAAVPGQKTRTHPGRKLGLAPAENSRSSGHRTRALRVRARL
jgi:NAD+ diphosphatase